MGKGGKKKGKKESEDIGGALGLLSLEDQPSTSSAVTTQEIKKDDPPPQKPAEPVEEDDIGGGLSLGDGGGKKRRKKKKDAAPKEASMPENPTQPATGPAVHATVPPAGRGQGRGIPVQSGWGAPLQGWGQSEPQGGVNIVQSGPPSQAGRGRGVSFSQQAHPGAPQPGSQMPQPWQGSQPMPQTQQPWQGSQPMPQISQPWQGSQPTPQMPQSQSAPQISQAPRELRPSTYQMPFEQERPTSSKAASVVSRFQIPKKVRGRAPIPADATRVLTNYLPMNIKPLIIHRYDVAVKPDRPKKFMARVFQAMKMKHFPKHILAYDQMKNCYALKPLLTSDERFITEVEIKDDNGKACKYEIGLKLTGKVDLGSIFGYMRDGTSLSPPTEAIHCIDVILRQGALESYVKASRQYFMRPRNPIDLGDGLEMWTGLFQSAIFTSRPFINIDVAHKGFPKAQPLVDTYMKDFRLDPNTTIERQRKMECELFVKYLRGLRVVATIGDSQTGFRKREFICNDIKPPPNALKFTMTDDSGASRTITVEQYFSEKGYRLRYPNINCIWVGPRDKEIYYPMELLQVSYGQALNRQLNERQLSKMVREAATPPSDRKRKIEEVIRDMKYSSNEYFKEFGLEISTNFYDVEAKVLHAPVLNVGEGTVRPRGGAWMAKKLLKASALQSWGFLVVDTDPNRLQCHDIIKKIQGVGRQMGMSVQEPALTNFNVRAHELLTIFRRAHDSRINFLFVIVSSRSRDLYQKVKKMAELEVGILTQCIKDATAERRMNEQTIRNILLKVNSKLMGVNQTLGTSSEPACLRSGGVMVVGADVTHPSPEQTDIPSIAAVTASFDTKCFQYNIELSIQTPKKEVIVEFESMMLEHLKVYKKHQNALPKKIFIFRDGVSEGQFAQVMNCELVAVYRAYERLAGCNVKPEVLFLLVQKRHHTRFFLGANNAQNVLPGTVVDKDIVHNSEMDFYLVSHQAIKGTARPTRYYGVRNDGNIPIEEVEQLTYYLCHLYSRCTRSVSYPTPTYYAHLACTRAKHLTAGDRFNNRDLEIKPQRLQVLNRMLDFSRMFFV